MSAVQKVPRLSTLNYIVLYSSLFVPWVPEDIFFLSILMVGGEAASMRRREKTITIHLGILIKP